MPNGCPCKVLRSPENFEFQSDEPIEIEEKSSDPGGVDLLPIMALRRNEPTPRIPGDVPEPVTLEIAGSPETISKTIYRLKRFFTILHVGPEQPADQVGKVKRIVKMVNPGDL